MIMIIIMVMLKMTAVILPEAAKQGADNYTK
jgi:hypothetical protein